MNAGEDKTTEKRKKLQYRLGLVFLGLCVFWIITLLTGTDLLSVGTKAPEWSLVKAGEDRDKLALGDLVGKVVVLDFWSIGCPPCVREIEELEAIRGRFGSRGVEIVGIASWGESLSDLREFTRERPIGYPIVLGNTDTVNAYKATSLPTLYVIDQKGVIAAAHRGFWPRDHIADAISGLLGRE
jgi:cytochrome c biogenesis protein CcmG/thiol:disulfide interchange protein DsbE